MGAEKEHVVAVYVSDAPVGVIGVWPIAVALNQAVDRGDVERLIASVGWDVRGGRNGSKPLPCVVHRGRSRLLAFSEPPPGISASQAALALQPREELDPRADRSLTAQVLQEGMVGSLESVKGHRLDRKGRNWRLMPWEGRRLADTDYLVRRGWHVDVEVWSNGRAALAIDVTHDIEFMWTLAELIGSGRLDEFIEAEVVAFGGAALQGRLLGVDSRSVGEPRAELGGRSLLDYHREKYPGRRRALDGVDPAGLAVLVKPISGAHRNDNLAFPPQILRPRVGFDDIEDGDSEAATELHDLTHLQPEERRELISELRSRLAQPWSAFGVELSDRMHRTSLGMWGIEAYADRLVGGNGKAIRRLTDLVRLGPAVRPPTRFRMVGLVGSTDAEKCRPVLSEVTACLRGWNLDFEARGIRLYNDRTPAAAEVDAEEKLVDGPSLALVSLPTSALKGGPDGLYAAVKRAAARRDVATQCFTPNSLTKWSPALIALGVVAKAGGQAALCPGLAQPGTLFVAFDLSRRGGVSHSACVPVVGHDGRILAQTIEHAPQRGERLADEFLGRVIATSIERAQREEGGVRRVVVLRDGRLLDTEMATLRKTLAPLGCLVDLVDVRKSGVPRIFAVDGRRADHPAQGFWFAPSDGECFLVTTGDPEYVRTPGVARPLRVVRRGGETPIATIARELFLLSMIPAGSTRSSRLPLPLHLADRYADRASDGVEFPRRAGVHAV